MNAENLVELNATLVGIIVVIFAFSGLTGIYFLFQFGMGIQKLGGTTSMFERPEPPKKLFAYFVASTFCFYLIYWIAILQQSMFISSEVQWNTVFSYSDASAVSSGEEVLTKVAVRLVLILIGVVFVYGGTLDLVDMASENSQKGWGSVISKYLSGVSCIDPISFLSIWSFLPFVSMATSWLAI